MYLFFFNDTATTEIYTLSLHDALPIYALEFLCLAEGGEVTHYEVLSEIAKELKEKKLATEVRSILKEEKDHLKLCIQRSEEHTSELQSRQYLVCRLLLEKKK